MSRRSSEGYFSQTTSHELKIICLLAAIVLNNCLCHPPPLSTTTNTRSFSVDLNDKMFQNTFGFENDEAGRVKGLGADYAARMFNFEGIEVGTLRVY